MMEFATQWRSPECTVEQWYQVQLARSRLQRSSTRFSVIWHYRTLNAPFYHEFLVIPLADGSYYRVERMGVGSSIDALTQSGCTACDLIEWFPPGKHKTLIDDQNSILIAEVRFPSDFDILDVLAICYSIQRNQAACRYTLQRYNCYFFCCTILSMLARLKVDSRMMDSSGQWRTLVSTVLNSIFSLSNPAQAKPYFALRVCSALDPVNPLAAQFVLEELSQALLTEFDGFQRLQILFAGSLWLSDFTLLLCAQLRASSRTAARAAYEKHSLSLPPQALMSAYNDELDKTGKNVYEHVAYICMQEDMYVSTKSPNRSRKQLLPFISGLRLGARMAAFFTQPTASSTSLGKTTPRSTVQQGLFYIDFFDHIANRLDIGATRSRIAATVQPVELQLGAAQDSTQGVLAIVGEPDMSRAISHETANAALDRLESIGMSDPSHVVSLCRLLEHSKHQSCWEHSIEELVSDTLAPAVKADTSRSTVLLVYATKAGLASSRADIFEFQDYIRGHIKTYADRVEKHQLDSSELVCRDVKDTMLEVWQSMPAESSTLPARESRSRSYLDWLLDSSA
ncbi:hypothetical protein FRC12_005372 [Ceratobasidium sp. 428]|nr:hypothetical protein FRC12_005372 [Ceratobasidium sp. 428]